MRIMVFGGAGGAASEVVRQAQGHGHSVTLFGRDDVSADVPNSVQRVIAEATVFEAVETAMAGHDAVVSTIASDVRGPGGSVSAASANIIHAMAVHRAGKLAVVSAAGASRRDDPNLPFVTRAAIATIQRERFDDIEGMERRVKASGIVWTIVRPTSLTDGPATGAYRFTVDESIPSKPKPVSRADVAAALLKALETSLWDRRVVTVTG